jgi:hypothetical protein
LVPTLCASGSCSVDCPIPVASLTLSTADCTRSFAAAKVEPTTTPTSRAVTGGGSWRERATVGAGGTSILTVFGGGSGLPIVKIERMLPAMPATMAATMTPPFQPAPWNSA